MSDIPSKHEKRLIAAEDWNNRQKGLAQLKHFAVTGAIELTDEQAVAVSSIYDIWTPEWTGDRGTRLQDEGGLYQSLHDILNVAQNTKPSETPSMWARVGSGTGEVEFPEWVPYGGVIMYNIGSKTNHNNKNWVSEVDNNVWEPGVYGWVEAV